MLWVMAVLAQKKNSEHQKIDASSTLFYYVLDVHPLQDGTIGHRL